MSNTTINPANVVTNELIAEVRKIAENNPNHVYGIPNPSGWCMYTFEKGENDTNNCGCIIGRAIHNLYPELWEIIHQHEINVLSKDGKNSIFNSDYPNINSVLCTLYRCGWSHSLNTTEICWLLEVQGWQDKKCEWKYCVDAAERVDS